MVTGPYAVFALLIRPTASKLVLVRTQINATQSANAGFVIHLSRRRDLVYSCCLLLPYLIRSQLRPRFGFLYKDAPQTATSLNFAHLKRYPKGAWPSSSPLTVV